VSARASRGFTLIEAIVLIAILGILATIAVPNFIRLQTRTRTSEALTNLALLRDAQASAYAELGSFIRAGSAPAGVPGTRARPWAGANTLEFRELLGFVPEGDVYFQYGANGSSDAFTLTAMSDLDGSGARAQFGFVHPAPGERIGIAHEFGSCKRSGVHDAKSGLPIALDEIGPCGPEDGISRL
jgi:prepilin-type N-terminal cleavage/methylation domain-containing protein